MYTAARDGDGEKRRTRRLIDRRGRGRRKATMDEIKPRERQQRVYYEPFLVILKPLESTQ